MARRGDSAIDQNQTDLTNQQPPPLQQPPTGAPGTVPAPTPSPGMPTYDPNNPNTWIEPTQPGGTGAAAANANPTAYGLNAPPPVGGPNASVSGPSAPGPQGAAFGGFNNIPGLYGQIFGGLPQGPNTNVPIPNPQSDPYEVALRQAIMSAIQEGQSPINPNDPTLSPIIQSMQGQAQRAMDLNKEQVGERMYAQGLPVSGGGYDSRVLGFNQQTNEATQGNIANVLVNQLNDRRNRLMTALNLGSNYLNAEQSRVLQAELANVSNALSSYGMRSNIGLGILGQLLQNAQYYSGLGTNANQFAQNQNNQSVNIPL